LKRFAGDLIVRFLGNAHDLELLRNGAA
ncbi:MAG: hypothetical protein ACI8Z0_000554, partial [Lentimonas sp.]